MILRSRKIPARPPKEPQTPKKSTDCDYPVTPQCGGRGQRKLQPKSPRDGLRTPLLKKNAGCLINDCRDSLEDEALETPFKERSVRVHFQVDESDCEKAAIISSIFSPVLCFTSPQVKSSGCCSPRTRKQSRRAPALEQPYFSHLPEDDLEEGCKPCKLIFGLPSIPYEKHQRWKEIPFKTRSSPENTLVLDPEKILVNSSLLPYPDPDYTFLVPFQDTYYKVYVKLHPHAREFLEALCKVYEIFVFTTAKKVYAEKVLEILDPQKKLFKHRLFQDHCVCVSGHYVKDLRIIQRDLAKTVVLDTAPYNFPSQIANRFPVKNWTGSQNDNTLLTLLPVLEELTLADDVRLAISHQFNIEKLHDEI